MSVVRCPRCRDEVTVPPGAGVRALVRCPLCLEQYLLAEALANAPPLLVIIGGDVPNAAIQRPAESESDYKIATGGFSPAVFESAGPISTVTIPPSRTAGGTPTIRTGRRAPRREISGLLFLVNVVAGGLLAAPLALLTLWWVFGVDPPELGPLGPKVAKYAPWAVPAGLRGDGEPEPPRLARPDRVKSREPSRAAVATEKRPAESTELQTLPGFDEPSRAPVTTLRPSVDAPREGRTPAQPMPDLKDLLPD
jgi:hypothetical protein